ncbi:MAG TPA: EAL domain-containing protein [Candidatus Baltobacteraceae bacterium]|nr:EAL domain-containing protein [Candidatus Baltobacteraceae bacterium]
MLGEGAALFASSPVPMWVYDRRTLRFLDVNDAAVATYGYSREEFLAMSLLDIRPEEDRERVRARFAQLPDHSGWSDEGWRHVKKDGRVIDVEVAYSSAPERDGVAPALAIVHDVSKRNEALRALGRLAYRDAATGLPNRAALEREADRDPGPAGMLLVHLTWVTSASQRSRDARDGALRVAADQLRRIVPEEAMLARWGDDVFAVRLAGAKSRTMSALAKRIVQGFEVPLAAGDEEVVVIPRVGVACGDEAQAIARDAQAALDASPAGCAGIEIFTPALALQRDRRAIIDRELRHAIAQRRLTPLYQPIVSIETGVIVGAEALMRWNCPGLGPVPPSEFIAIAEESGIILRLGEWMLREALAQNRRWQIAGLPNLRIAVNVSARQIEQRDFVKTVDAVCRITGHAHADVELELSETSMMRRDGVSQRNLHALRRLGVRVAVDDFGTGFSSLSYLEALPLDVLKIDRSFVQSIAEDAYKADVARLVVELAQRRGLSVVGVGVENASQLRTLRTLGCDEAQGYLFGAPMSGEAFGTLLERDPVPPHIALAG